MLAQSNSKIWGAAMFAMMPIMGAAYFGGAQNAGLMIGILTGLQVFIFNPIAGQLIDKKNSLWAFWIGIGAEILGSLIFILFPHWWALILFFMGFSVRWSFFVSESYILKQSKSEEGGFIFGLREELFAMANFAGILLFPLFIISTTWSWLPVLTILFATLSALLIIDIPKDSDHNQKLDIKKALNIWSTISAASRFITINHKFPLFVLGSKIFEGIFYGSIWFLFPLHLSRLIVGGDNSLHLGIYEIVTICLALFCGLLADRWDWRKLEARSWALMLIMIWLLPFWHSPLALVFLGFFIGAANNFFMAASYHALAKHDVDHEEDGQFNSFADTVMNLGYMIAPVICGILYQAYGFQVSLLFVASSVTIIGIWMLTLCVRNRYN